jgi:hypothetical protein
MPRTADRELETLQALIEKIASRQISEEEGRRLFMELWEKAGEESVYRKILRELFPSLIRSQPAQK